MPWTDTYDVLKPHKTTPVSIAPCLNRHIWCIETCQDFLVITFLIYLNRHIWCIETCPKRQLENFHPQLEPTHMMYWNKKNALKFFEELNLNRHIWCIETMCHLVLLWYRTTWTDTYDVLKLEFANTCINRLFSWTDTYDVLKLF